MDRDVKTILIPNDLCRRAGITANWFSINQMGVFSHQKIMKAGKPSPFASSQPVSIFHLRQDVILFKPYLRMLVNEANGIFEMVQNVCAAENVIKHSELLKHSRQYRSIIRACLENLQDEVTKANDEEEKEQLQNYITIFYSVECVWHLCEILFIDAVPGNVVLPHLLDWIRFHFPKYERNTALMLMGDLTGLETHPDYWETIIGSFLQGRIREVSALLKQHSMANTEPFKMFDQCLKAMPVYSMFSGVTVAEFSMQWQHWVVDVQSKIDAKQFVSCYNLNLLMKLAVGNDVAWGEIQQYCETWYELLAAWLFFTQPMVKAFELGQYAKQCIMKMSIRNNMRHLDRVLLAAMEFDVLQLIKEIEHMNDNGWFVTHLTDLFYHSGNLEKITIDNADFSSEKLRRSFVSDYATLLISHKSLWQVSLTYLDHCGKDDLEISNILLQRLPLYSEYRTQKIVREALNRNLFDAAQSICKVQAVHCKNRGRMGNALAWALKSQDSMYISHLADILLKNYVKTGNMEHVDLLENLGSSILTSDRLVFLAKYCEFHKLLKLKDLKQAGNLLISLLDSKIVPNYFWPVLFQQVIPLLSNERIVLSSNDTFTILNCLEGKEKYVGDKIKILRTVAANNLGRTLILEAQNK